MSLSPLLDAPLAIQLHAYAAVGAFGLGVLQLAGVKGTARHRALGYTWVALMLIVALSSFSIHAIGQLGGYSLIHLLSIWVLISLPLAVLAARGGRVGAHKRAMVSLFLGALVVAGALTLLPGRIMHQVVFGG
jgi:uncharacterized membrane protein